MHTKSSLATRTTMVITLLVLGALGTALAAETVHVLPGAAEKAGALGSRWESTVWVLNAGDEAAVVSFGFVPFAGKAAPLSVTRSVAAGEVLVVDRALSTLFVAGADIVRDIRPPRRRLPRAYQYEGIARYLSEALLRRPATEQEILSYRSFFTGDLWTGAQNLAVSMVESGEYANDVLSATGARYQSPATTLNAVYGAFLGRCPDAVGVRASLPLIKSGQAGVRTVVHAMLGSGEFATGSNRDRLLAGTYAGTPDCGFLERVYEGAVVPNDYAGTIEHEGRTRKFFVHVPPKYFDLEEPVPLVFVLHSAGGSGPSMVGFSRMNPKADGIGALVVYPNGTPHSTTGDQEKALAWNATHCCGQPVTLQVDDVGFLMKLLAHLQARLVVDEKRVYSTGFSNGAIMSQYLAAAHPEAFAAIGGVASTAGGCKTAGCESLVENIDTPQAPSIPVPAILFNGMADTTFLIYGGHAGGGARFDLQFSIALSALHAEWPKLTYPGSSFGTLDFWVQANGQDNAPLVDEHVQYKGGLQCTRLVYDQPSVTNEVIGYACQGVGHTHPTCASSDPQPCLDEPSETWAFFMRHARP